MTTNGPRRRPMIEERAARRERLNAPGRDRFSSLMRALQAGTEVPVRSPSRSRPIEWNPIGRKLLMVAGAVIAAWFALSVLTGWWRDNHVDTWSGPDATVQSGTKLAACEEVEQVRDETFPSWIRYKGSIYRLTAFARPFIGLGVTAGFHDSGYSQGSMRLILIDNTPDGRSLDTIMLWNDGGIAGREMTRVTDC